MPTYGPCRYLMNPSIDKNTMQSFLSESEVHYRENGQGAEEVDDFSVGFYFNDLQTGFEVKYLCYCYMKTVNHKFLRTINRNTIAFQKKMIIA